MTKAETECATGPEVRCDVVTLFNGGKYQLYKYRRFQDVRLAFAPEFPMASFGGDPDNSGKEPFKLPDTWLAAQGKVPPETPLDMATTNDIIGGNSGSPMVNRDGHVVGLIFDGNLASLGGRYAYVPATNRAVAVNGMGILTGLDHIYGAQRLVDELRAAQAP
jgi:hypothetical protein